MSWRPRLPRVRPDRPRVRRRLPGGRELVSVPTQVFRLRSWWSRCLWAPWRRWYRAEVLDTAVWVEVPKRGV